MMATKHISSLQVLEAYADYQARVIGNNQSPFVDKILHVRTGQPKKVCAAAMRREVERGFVEYGTGLGGGWLTRMGVAALNASRYVKTEFGWTLKVQ